MFKIGDIVESNGLNVYIHTTPGVACKVVGINGSYIKVIIPGHEYGNVIYDVKAKNFKLFGNEEEYPEGEWI